MPPARDQRRRWCVSTAAREGGFFASRCAFGRGIVPCRWYDGPLHIHMAHDGCLVEVRAP
eukprot:4026621-Prymnesium_polylepis.1